MNIIWDECIQTDTVQRWLSYITEHNKPVYTTTLKIKPSKFLNYVFKRSFPGTEDRVQKNQIKFEEIKQKIESKKSFAIPVLNISPYYYGFDGCHRMWACLQLFGDIEQPVIVYWTDEKKLIELEEETCQKI